MEKIFNIQKYIEDEYKNNSVYLKDEIENSDGEKIVHIYKLILINKDTIFGIRIIDATGRDEIGTVELDADYFKKCGAMHNFYAMTENEFNTEFENMCDYFRDLE